MNKSCIRFLKPNIADPMANEFCCIERFDCGNFHNFFRPYMNYKSSAFLL